MTLPVSGPMQASMINVELFRPATNIFTLDEAPVRTLAAKPSGIISLNDFYGKSNRVIAPTVTISANTANYIFNPAKVTGYIAGKTDAILIINTGIYVYATTTAGAGLTVSGWATGDTVTVINNGYIIGQGGNGANGSNAPIAGIAGGPAISLSYSTIITNNAGAYIAGGGGGGGNGANTASNANFFKYGGSGGGGAGGGIGGTGNYGGVRSGGAGGGLGLAGGTGQSADGFSTAVSGGGGGGRALPGAGGTVRVNGAGGSGGGAGGAGGGVAMSDGVSGLSDNGKAGGSANAVGVATGTLQGGAGGGGWGAAGGAGHQIAGGAGGKAIALNGFTATRSGTGTTYGAVS